MNIKKATREALEQAAHITRLSWNGNAKVAPAYAKRKFIKITAESRGRESIMRWKPSIGDLVANDWIVMKKLNICEATKRAIREGRCIVPSNEIGAIKIKPTNGRGNCVLMRGDGSNPSKYGWQPSAADLTRDDWIVVD